MTPKNPDFAAHVAEIFTAAPFVQALGIELTACGPGWCTARMVVRPDHLQQTGVVHAGALATFADHTCGGAAETLTAPGDHILSVEFKNNMLRAARADLLTCRAEVLKPGRTITVVEGRVHAHLRGDLPDDAPFDPPHEQGKLVSAMTCTLMTIHADR